MVLSVAVWYNGHSVRYSDALDFVVLRMRTAARPKRCLAQVFTCPALGFPFPFPQGRTFMPQRANLTMQRTLYSEREEQRMQKHQTSVPFQGTKDQEKLLMDAIGQHRGQQGALMPILQAAQEIYGYLPIQVQKIIADEMDIPLEEVYGTASFYAQFTLNPKGTYKVSVCLGTACYVKGSQKIIERVAEKLGVEPGGITADGKFSLDATRCVGACGLAPVMIVNDDVYGRLVPDDVDKILAKYK